MYGQTFISYIFYLEISETKCFTTITKTIALLVTGMEVGLEVKIQKPKYMFMSCQQNAGQNHNIKTGRDRWRALVSAVMNLRVP
jgi:hypothetical protein